MLNVLGKTAGPGNVVAFGFLFCFYFVLFSGLEQLSLVVVKFG